MSSFYQLINYLTATAGVCDVWVDGSFVTEKDNPGDIDLTVVVRAEILESLSVTAPEIVEDLIAVSLDERFAPDLHVFLIAVRPLGHPDHAALEQAARNWAQWWSVTREAWIKGFAVIALGESDVALRLLP